MGVLNLARLMSSYRSIILFVRLPNAFGALALNHRSQKQATTSKGQKGDATIHIYTSSHLHITTSTYLHVTYIYLHQMLFIESMVCLMHRSSSSQMRSLTKQQYPEGTRRCDAFFVCIFILSIRTFIRCDIFCFQKVARDTILHQASTISSEGDGRSKYSSFMVGSSSDIRWLVPSLARSLAGY
jgi:hypothetical protein